MPSPGHTPDREPASDRAPCRTPRRILGRCSALQANRVHRGQGRSRRRCRGHRRGQRGSDAGVCQAADACIREVASARAALPPRSPWTSSERLE
jgi:hypothetical protein